MLSRRLGMSGMKLNVAIFEWLLDALFKHSFIRISSGGTLASTETVLWKPLQTNPTLFWQRHLSMILISVLFLSVLVDLHRFRPRMSLAKGWYTECPIDVESSTERSS